MKTTIYILLFMISLSCVSQKTDLDVTGNWYNYYPTGNSNVSYVETYYDSDIYYLYYEESGLKFGGKYSIEIDKMFLYLNEESENDFIEVKMTEDVIELKIQGKTGFLKKIPDNPYSLEKFINKEITEKEYFQYGYSKRKLNWKKKGTVE